MKLNKLYQLIDEALNKPKKDDCGCTGGDAPLLTESKVKDLLSEGLQYHIDKKVPLHNTIYRYGSEKHLLLVKEARRMYSRGVIDLSEDDKQLISTNLGEFGIYEGVEVPLDLPMINEEYSTLDLYNIARRLKNQGLVVKIKPSRFDEDIYDVTHFAGDIDDLQSALNSEFGKDNYRISFDDHSTYNSIKENLDKVAGGIPYKVEGNKAIISTPLPDDAKERIIKRAEENGYSAKPNMSGGVTIFKEVQLDLPMASELYEQAQQITEDIKLQGAIQPSALRRLKNQTKDNQELAQLVLDFIIELTRDNNLPDDYGIQQAINYLSKVAIKGGEPAPSKRFRANPLKVQEGEELDEKKKVKKKKKDPPIGKPKRGGSKAYYVYVRDPKTKRIKKVSFGSGGLRAKIKNRGARAAFAKRHRCSEKNDRTKASYWSCRLPRYAQALGLGSNSNTFW